MKVFDLNCPDAAAAAVAGVSGILRQPGAVAVVPTETVYGLVSRVTDEGARRIYELKRRPAEKRLGWFVGDWRQLAGFGVELTALVVKLAERLTPGPVTIIAPDASGGGIGFRVPDHPFLLALLRELGEPLLQTSANRSGGADPRSLGEALAGLDGEADVGVDGGVLPLGALASTVIDARTAVPKILRQGALRVDLSVFMES